MRSYGETQAEVRGLALRPRLAQWWLGVSDGLVGEEGEAVTDGLGVGQTHRFLAAGLAEETLAGPQDDRVDHQPQLVDQIVLQ
jgi:hypothetical protein